MIKWLKLIHVKAILPAAALLAAAAVGTTFAWQTWNLNVTNELKAHSTVVEVDEDFHPETGTKKVKFTNKGSSSVFLRVSYSEYWDVVETIGTEQQKRMLSNTWPAGINGDSGKEIAKKNMADSWIGGANCEWTDGGDGWYYYNKILKKGRSTDPILNGVEFPDGEKLPAGYYTKVIRSEDTDGDGESEEYTDYIYNYKLFFKAEAVQCSDGGNTLNSDEVNAEATYDVFEKIAVVDSENPETVKWYNRNDSDLPSELNEYLKKQGK